MATATARARCFSDILSSLEVPGRRKVGREITKTPVNDISAPMASVLVKGSRRNIQAQIPVTIGDRNVNTTASDSGKYKSE